LQESVKKMMRLFAGYPDAYGTHGTEKSNGAGKKVEIKSSVRTARGKVTEELWADHLSGKRPIGIIPLKENETCSWGVIDIDKYDVDHVAIFEKLEEVGIPMVVCRSKSGGAHVFAFFAEEQPADQIIEALRGVAAVLGHGTAEIFPKQTRVLLEKGDLANWLNMPYFDAEVTKRYAVTRGGKGMSLEIFLKYAENKLCTLEDLRKRPPPKRTVLLPRSPYSSSASAGQPEFSDGPPCLEHMSAEGVPEGNRNNALFNYAILAKRKYPDNWQEVLERWNRECMTPPLPIDEVQQIMKSVGKKDYPYRCKDAPLSTFCNSGLCKTREFGIRAGATPTISSIAILDTQPPLFFVTMDGGSVECSSEDILNPRAFQKMALEQLRVVTPLYNAKEWLPHIQRCIENATLIEAPDEAGTDGHFYELLERFCTDRHAAREADEMLLGRPWTSPEDKRVYFRLRDLMSFLDRERFRELTRQQITQRIKNYGGDQKFFNLRGKGFNTFWVPDIFHRQTEAHDTPASGGGDI
jgi:Primase C terminal 1 (PriCT-1)